MFTYCCKYVCFPEHTAVPKETQTDAGEMIQPRLQGWGWMLQCLSQSGLCIRSWATLLLPVGSLNSAEAVCSSTENCLTGKSQAQTAELWHSLEIHLITFFYIFLSSNIWLQQWFHPSQSIKREQKVYSSICYIHLDQWMSKPGKNVTCSTIFLDRSWSTSVFLGLVVQWFCFLLISATRTLTNGV